LFVLVSFSGFVC